MPPPDWTTFPEDDETHLRAHSRLPGTIALALACCIATFPFVAAYFGTVGSFVGDWKTYPAAIILGSAILTAFGALYYAPHALRWKNPAQIPLAVVINVRSSADDSELRLLTELLWSISRQSIPPQAVVISENGRRRNKKLQLLFKEWSSQPEQEGILAANHIHLKHADKGRALIAAARLLDPNMVVATCDSYTLLRRDTLEKARHAFADPRVMAATGLLVGHPSQRKLLPRLLDMLFVASYFQERAAQSAIGSLGSTRGGLAFYMAHFLKEYGASIVSRRVPADVIRDGEDRALTMACLRAGGKAVFWPSSVAYTRHPESFVDASRRYARWWRICLRSNIATLLRPPTRRGAWWLSLQHTLVVIAQGAGYPAALFAEPIFTGQPPWLTLAFIGATGTCRLASTLALRRGGESLWQQCRRFVAMLPLAILLELWLTTAVMLYGLATIHNKVWRPWLVSAPTKMSVK